MQGMGRPETYKEFWLETLKGRDHSEDLGLNGERVLHWTLGKYLGMWTAFVWLKICTSGDPCERGNKLPLPFKGGNFLTSRAYY